MNCRDVVNGKAGKAAALPKFSCTLTLSQSRGADYPQPLALPHLKILHDYTPKELLRKPSTVICMTAKAQEDSNHKVVVSE
jgi:hypothetical protein